MMKNLDLENLDLEPHDKEVKISISSRKLKKVSRRSLVWGVSSEAPKLYYVIYEQPLMIKRNMITTSITVVIIIIIIHLMMKRGVFRTEIFDRGQESGENL